MIDLSHPASSLSSPRTRFLLDLYTDYLLVSFGQASATGLAALLPQVVSHDQITRFLARNEFGGGDLWQIVKPHIRKIQADDACLIFDDTVEEKPYTDANEIITWHYDHCQNRSIKGVNLLTALYHSNGMSLPVDFTLIHKTEWVKDHKTGKEHWASKETKNEMMRRMINGFIRTQTPFRYVLADTWFASAENMAFIKQKKGKEFVFPLKANRKVALTEEDKQKKRFVSVDSLTSDNAACLTIKTIYLEQVDFPLLLMRSAITNDSGKTSVLYLVTSDLTLSDASALLTLYQKRWKIEEFHKSIKSHASFAKSPTRTVRTQSNHFFASLVGYVKMEVARVGLAIKHSALRGQLYQAALARAWEQLQKLKAKYPQAAITL
jgi:hypothetical protein